MKQKEKRIKKIHDDPKKKEKKNVKPVIASTRIYIVPSLVYINKLTNLKA